MIEVDGKHCQPDHDLFPVFFWMKERAVFSLNGLLLAVSRVRVFCQTLLTLLINHS